MSRCGKAALHGERIKEIVKFQSFTKVQKFLTLL